MIFLYPLASLIIGDNDKSAKNFSLAWVFFTEALIVFGIAFRDKSPSSDSGMLSYVIFVICNDFSSILEERNECVQSK